jgi:hypothetical protein
MLRNPAGRRWLGDIVPAWTLLAQDSLAALRKPPSLHGSVLKLATDLAPEEIARSAITRNALTLLHSAAVFPGFKPTATGNLSRQVVAEMWEMFSWPDFDKEEARRFHKVINEPDFPQLFLIRHLVEEGRLIKRRRDRLRITPAGQHMLESPGCDALHALLFHLAFWALDLSALSRGLLDGRPQIDIGIVLWSLSVSANAWQSREQLTRLCTIPANDIVDADYDKGTYAMDTIGLRPLL